MIGAGTLYDGDEGINTCATTREITQQFYFRERSLYNAEPPCFRLFYCLLGHIGVQLFRVTFMHFVLYHILQH